MSVEFSKKAGTYDRDFTDTYVGRIQRQRIWEFVEEQLEGKENLEILELNCGTGADISFLKQYGNVLATDASEEMIEMAGAKNKATAFKIMDLNDPLELSQKFDLVFSNFGGMNCVSPARMKELSHELAALLNPGGQLILTLMHSWSYIEFCYFMSRLKFKKALRRLSKKSTFGNIDIYYYSAKDIRNIFTSFQTIKRFPTGILLAGEYTNGFGKTFGIRERRAKWLFPLYGADHVVYVMKKK